MAKWQTVPCKNLFRVNCDIWRNVASKKPKSFETDHLYSYFNKIDNVFWTPNKLSIKLQKFTNSSKTWRRTFGVEKLVKHSNELHFFNLFGKLLTIEFYFDSFPFYFIIIYAFIRKWNNYLVKFQYFPLIRLESAANFSYLWVWTNTLFWLAISKYFIDIINANVNVDNCLTLSFPRFKCFC